MKIPATVEAATLWNENDREVDGVAVTCTRCGMTVEVYGTSDRSIRRGCVLLAEGCPNSERNFYEPDQENV